MYTLESLKLQNKLEKIMNLEPSQNFWEKFAEKQLKKVASERDSGESIQGTSKGTKK